MSVTHPTVGFTNILRPIHELQRNKGYGLHFLINNESLLNTSLWVCKPGWLTSVAHWVIVCPTAAACQWANPDKSFRVLQREDGAREQEGEWCQSGQEDKPELENDISMIFTHNRMRYFIVSYLTMSAFGNLIP